ncbi:MAG: hypothetical protein ACRCTQ_00205 [Brevinemataceae bacterium]
MLPPEIQVSQVKQVKSIYVSVDDFPLATIDKSNHLIVENVVDLQDYLIRTLLLTY